MAEVGCLKDGHFQNLEASNILLGSKSLVAPLSSQGKIILDPIAALTDAGDGNVTLDSTHMGSVYIISGVLSAHGRSITLPDITQVNVGEQILFVVTGSVDASERLSILTTGTNLFYGVVEVSVAANVAQNFAGALKTVGQLPVTNAAATAHGIGLLNGATGCNTGSRFLFTCVGGTSHTAGEGGAGGTVATLTAGTDKVWLVEGNAVCDATAPTGGAIVGAHAV